MAESLMVFKSIEANALNEGLSAVRVLQRNLAISSLKVSQPVLELGFKFQGQRMRGTSDVNPSLRSGEY